MKKKINFGVITLLVCVVLVITFLIAFGSFYSSESKKIKSDIEAELRTTYSKVFDETNLDDVVFLSKTKADITMTLLVESQKQDFYVSADEISLQVVKKDGKWTVNVYRTIEIPDETPVADIAEEMK